MSGSVTAVWPPTGIALAAVILWGYRIWPGVALGAFLANSWTGVPLYAVLGDQPGQHARGTRGCLSAAPARGLRPSLERVRDVVALVVPGRRAEHDGQRHHRRDAACCSANEITGRPFGTVWRTWWLGDIGGDLIVAPALLVAVTHWPFRRAPGRVLEAVALGTVVAAVSVVVFSASTPLVYLIFPPLIWAALRFWQPGATATSLIAAGVAIAFAEADRGPFAG